MKNMLSRDNLILAIGIVSGAAGIVLGFGGFVWNIAKGKFDCPWLFILIFLVVFIYRLYTKQTVIKLLAPDKPGTKTTSVEDALGYLKAATGEPRVNTLRNLFPLLPNNMSGEEAAKLLWSLTGKYRVDAIQTLAPKIQTKNAREIELVLNSLTGDFQKDAAYFLMNRTSTK